MKPIHQTKFGKEGNCFAACIASVLDCEIDSVPFWADSEEWKKYQSRLNSFLKTPSSISFLC